jgi:Leucine-rich repeat (LRR) protein
LVELDLSSNRLTTDEFNKNNTMVLLGLSSLRRLDMSGNQLGELSVSTMFSVVQSTLEDLDLSRNYIRFVISDALSDMESLERLNLSKNRIETIHLPNFRRLESLQSLDLSENRILNLSNSMWENCISLTVLNLSRNLIQFVEFEAFRGLHNLKELYLDENLLTATISFELPMSLRQLIIDGSRHLAAIDERSFGGGEWPWLERLSISRCPALTDIQPHAFGRMRRLEVVKIADNPRLTTIDELSFIDKSDVFWMESMETSTIQMLNLSGNSLGRVDGRLVNWTNLKQFDLTGNAWQCDCHLDWLTHANVDRGSLSTLVLVFILRAQVVSFRKLVV